MIGFIVVIAACGHATAPDCPVSAAPPRVVLLRGKAVQVTYRDQINKPPNEAEEACTPMGDPDPALVLPALSALRSLKDPVPIALVQTADWEGLIRAIPGANAVAMDLRSSRGRFSVDWNRTLFTYCVTVVENGALEVTVQLLGRRGE